MTATETPVITAGTWAIEPMHSEVGFTVRHLGMSKVRGRFNTFSGSAVIDQDLAHRARPLERRPGAQQAPEMRRRGQQAHRRQPEWTAATPWVRLRYLTCPNPAVRIMPAKVA